MYRYCSFMYFKKSLSRCWTSVRILSYAIIYRLYRKIDVGNRKSVGSTTSYTNCLRLCMKYLKNEQHTKTYRMFHYLKQCKQNSVCFISFQVEKDSMLLYALDCTIDIGKVS